MKIRKNIKKIILALAFMTSASQVGLTMESLQGLEEWQRKIIQGIPADLRPFVKWHQKEGKGYESDNDHELRLFWTKDNWQRWSGCDLNLMPKDFILSPIFLGEHPTAGSLNSIKEGQLGLFADNDKLYCKVFGKDLTEITVDEDAVKVTQRGLPRGVFDTIIGTVTNKIKDVGALGFADQMGTAPVAGKHYNDAYESISEYEWSSLLQFLSYEYLSSTVQILSTTSIGGRTHWRDNKGDVIKALKGEYERPVPFTLVILSKGNAVDIFSALNEYHEISGAIVQIILKDSHFELANIFSSPGRGDLCSLLKNSPNLGSLNFKRCNLSNEGMLPIINAIASLPGLKSLNLSNNNLDSHILENMSGVLSSLANLTFLNLSHNNGLKLGGKIIKVTRSIGTQIGSVSKSPPESESVQVPYKRSAPSSSYYDNSSTKKTRLEAKTSDFISFLPCSLQTLKLANTGINSVSLKELQFSRLTSLTHLDLSHNNLQIINEHEESAFQHLLKSIVFLKDLKSLKLSDTDLENKDIIPSIFVFSILSGLHNLDISNNKISKQDFYTFLKDAAPNLTNLEYLNISNNKTDSMMLDVSALFEDNEIVKKLKNFIANLHGLNIGGNQVDFCCLAHRLPHFTNLHSLQIGNIIDTNSQQPEIQSFNQTFLQTLTGWPHLQVLDLEGLSFLFQRTDAPTVKSFAAALGSMQNLKSLNLSRTRIGDFKECRNDFFVSLGSLHNLKELRLGGFSKIGFSGVLPYIVLLSNLRILDLSNNQGDKPYDNMEDIDHLWNSLILNRWPHLRELHLQSNGIHIMKALDLKSRFDPVFMKLDPEVGQLFRLLRENTLGKELVGKFKNDQLTDIEFTTLLAPYLAANPDLTVLDLSRAEIGVEGAKALNEVLKDNTTVTSLNLDHTNIGEEGIKILAECLFPQNTTLKTLSLGGNLLKIKGLKALVKALQEKSNTNFNLENLEVSEQEARNNHKILEEIANLFENYYEALEEIGNLFANNETIKINGRAGQGRVKGELEKPGKDVVQDNAKTWKWFEETAAQNNATAQNWLGFCYGAGRGVQQNYNEALKYYIQAAKQRHAWAQNNLGLLYYNGQGVEQDYVKAREWYEKAANQGNQLARDNLLKLDALIAEWHTSIETTIQQIRDLQNNKLTIGEFRSVLAAMEKFYNGKEEYQEYRRWREESFSDVPTGVALNRARDRNHRELTIISSHHELGRKLCSLLKKDITEKMKKYHRLKGVLHPRKDEFGRM